MEDRDWLLIIVGILGLTALLALTKGQSLGASPQAVALQAEGQQSKSPGLQIFNAETWEWVDWQGRNRALTVHRDVKQVG